MHEKMRLNAPFGYWNMQIYALYNLNAIQINSFRGNHTEY